MTLPPQPQAPPTPIASSSFASVILADHEIHLFYEIDGIPLAGPSLTLSTILGPDPDCLPEDQTEALNGRYSTQAVWQGSTEDVGSDLYEHLREIVSGRREDLATVWALTPQAARLIDSGDLYEEAVPAERRTRKRLRVKLGGRAIQRLRAQGVDPRPLALGIDRLKLHVFATGKSFLHAVVRLRPVDGEPAGQQRSLTALELLEGQAAILRFNRLSWESVAKTPAGKAPGFNLGLLMRRLACGYPASVRETARVLTYSYLRLGAPATAPAIDLLATHLARHYTTDYAVSEDIEGVFFIHAFENVLHAVSLEGAATIVMPSDASGSLPAFLDDFDTGTLHRHYLPIALMALHEYCFLVDRTSRSVINPKQERDANRTLLALARLRSDSLVFRLCFRFSQVSHISMHNELNHAFREALGLDRMLREFAADVAEIESFLRAVADHKVRTQFYLLTIIGGASLAGLSALTIFRESAKVLLRYDWVKVPLHALLAPAIDRGWISWPLHPDRIGLLLGLIVFLVAIWLIWRRRPVAHIELESESPMHSLLEQMSSVPKRRGSTDTSGSGRT